MYIKEFSELTKTDVTIAGGKGASLGEMTRAGIPVPDGFVVTAQSFDYFIEKTAISGRIQDILSALTGDDSSAIEQASKNIKTLVMEQNMPTEIEEEILASFSSLNTQYVAVRSSATAEDAADASWAGELESYLNTDKETLLLNVKKCWASLFTPRAIFYRIENNLNNSKVSVAVVVQKMVQSEISGIAFSVHPVTEDPSQIIIEAGYGLGEAIVSGAVTPDGYVVDKYNMSISTKDIKTQEKGIFKTEQGNQWLDIKKEKTSSQKLSDDIILELAGLVKIVEDHYGFGCDIEWALEKGDLFIVQSRPITTLGATENKNVAKIKNIKWQFWGRWPGAALYNSMWASARDSKTYKELGLEEVEGEIIDLDGNFMGRDSDYQIIKDFVQKSLRNESDFLERFVDKCHSSTEKLLSLPDNSDLHDLLLHIREAAACSILVYYCDMAITDPLKDLCNQHGTNVEDISAKMQPVKQTLSMIYNDKLRATDENELQKLVDDSLWVGARIFEGERLTLEKAKTEKSAQVASHVAEPLDSLPDDLRRIVEIGRELSFHRTNIYEAVNKAANPYWEVIETAGKANGLSYGDVLKMSHYEFVKMLLDSTIPIDLNSRQEKYGMIYHQSKIDFLTSQDTDLALSYVMPKAPAEGEISGMIAFRGKVQGGARLINNVSDIHKVQQGDIIVASETTPDYIVAMRQAAAFVTDQGGITSHAAIVSREMKKPCIIGTKYATQLIKDGDRIEVDAYNGIVRKI